MPIEICSLCKEEFSGASGALFCSKECLDKWRESIKESEYNYGD